MSDTLAALQKAFSPKAGMQRLPFPLDSYDHPSIPLQSKRLLNYFSEKEPGDSRTAAALIPTPGLVPFLSMGAGPVHAVNGEMPGRLYVVSGDRFFRVSPGLAIEDLGSVGTSMEQTGLVTIAVGMTGVVVCVPPNAYTCHHEVGTPLNQLGGTFPATGASSVATMDNYYAFTDFTDITRWFISRLLDPTDFDALDFVYADAMPNVLKIIVGHRGEFWVIGEKGIEVWYDAGNADFPFRRRSGSTIKVGTLSPKSVQVGAESVWWIGNDNVVYRSDGYHAKRVSNHANEADITARNPADAIGCSYHEMDGHQFYTFTLDDRTWTYDAVTDTWHERSSVENGVGRWRANCATQFSSEPVFGDFNTGQLMRLLRRGDADMGVALLRQAVLPPLVVSSVRGARAFCSRLEVEMEVGTAASHQDVLLEWADDGGYTFSGGPRTMSAGPAGTAPRVFTTRLGSFRQRVFRLTTRGASTLYAVSADISPGAH